MALWAIVMFGFWFMARRARQSKALDEGSQLDSASSALETDAKVEPELAGQGNADLQPAIGVTRDDIEPLPRRN